jgi:peptidoglycan/xylan/chitin deacetylase (PgdA/CDA1 family)
LLTRSLVLAALTAACTAAPGGDGDEAGQALVTKDSIFGRSFPPKTLLLTYDDGPDEHTLELAHYLHDEGISATFFVNGRRLCRSIDETGACVDPMPTRACDNGEDQAPVEHPKRYPESILDEVQALGHHVANHSEDHCNLPAQHDAAGLVFELSATQEVLDRHRVDGLKLFRPPYGAWDATSASRAEMEPALDHLVGPINWDIDGADYACWKDGLSVDACGRRYLDGVNARPNKNGIVIMHDRPEFNVGFAGPLLLTKFLVPRLRAQGFAFARIEDMPALPYAANFGVVTRRSTAYRDGAGYSTRADLYGTVRLGDVDGDGRADACARASTGIQCALAKADGSFEAPRSWLATDFTDAKGWNDSAHATTLAFVDIDGDGKADVCGRGVNGVLCAQSNGTGFGAATTRTTRDDFSDGAAVYTSVRFGDVDGDGFADVCARTASGVVCARNRHDGAFDGASTWIADEFTDALGWSAPQYGATVMLGDIDGDGRADVCGRGVDGIRCAISAGERFEHAALWSFASDFGDTDGWNTVTSYGSLRLVDVNGDRKADICGRSSRGVFCARSMGTRLGKETSVLHRDFSDATGWKDERYATTLMFADVDGDKRIDVCGRGVGGILCAPGE